MPRKKRKARKPPKRQISVKAAHRDKPDLEDVAKALVFDALKRKDNSHCRPP